MEKKYQPTTQQDKANGLTSSITPKDGHQSTLQGDHPPGEYRPLINSEGTQMNPPKPSNQPAPGRLLRLDAVENLTGLRKSSIYTYMANKSHGFPTPVRIGARAVAWREGDIFSWISQRAEARPQGGDK